MIFNKSNLKKFNVKSFHFKGVVGISIGFVLLQILSYIISPASANFADFANLLKQSAGLGLLAIGQTYVIITGGIDLCLGSIVTLVHVVTIGLMDGKAGNIIPVCMLGLLIGAVAGFLNGLGITKAKIAPFVMTLCTDFILRGLIMVYTKGQPKGTLAEAFRNVGRERVFGSISVSVFVWLFCSCLFIFILYKTVFGKHVRMVGANMECARFSGVNNDRVLISVYTIAGFLAALAAIILTTEMSATSLNLGADYSMDSISAVVIGGTMFSGGIGGVEGTIAGTLVIRLITSLLQKANVVNWGKLIIQSVLILGVVASNSRRKK